MLPTSVIENRKSKVQNPPVAWRLLVDEDLPGAMNMAVDEINAGGGVLGRKLEVLYRDDNFSPADAARLANELVLNQKVDLLAGTFLSPIALAVANYANQKKVMFVAAEALTNQLTWENM